MIHDFCAPAEGADGQAAANYFSKRREVRLDSVNFLGSATRDTKPGHHLIENQKRAMFCTFLAQDRQKIFARKIKSRVCGNRFENDGGNFIFLKCLSHKIDIVKRQRDC